jgi:hypothetical protein
MLAMTKKVDVELVRKTFEARGFKQLGPYKKAREKIDYECSKGHRHSISWTCLKRGNGCIECAGLLVRPETVRAAFEAAGYKQLSEYVNSAAKIEFECKKGHRYSQTWSNFQAGRRCQLCEWDARREAVEPETVIAAFNARGYRLLSPFVNSTTKISYECPKGHRNSIKWRSFKLGGGCPECAGKIVKPETVRAAFEARGFTQLSPYKRSTAKIKYRCSMGHENLTSWNLFRTGSGCPDCAVRGFNSQLPGELYYIRFDLRHFSLWKIGITSHTVKKRFSKETVPYTILNVQHFDVGADARRKEQAILQKYAAYKYNGERVLQSGNTECFTRDVLGLDTQPMGGLSDSWKLNAILDRAGGKREDSPKEKTFRHRKATYHQLDLFTAA